MAPECGRCIALVSVTQPALRVTSRAGALLTELAKSSLQPRATPRQKAQLSLGFANINVDIEERGPAFIATFAFGNGTTSSSWPCRTEYELGVHTIASEVKESWPGECLLP